ncbi:hypothetical protein JOB18_044625 [Solea senegalensis]|uniref:Uncharacterized protein n=1 Tax=Solea senegalensis TaxID=28829 RepID=A0AAV6S1G2_SOLSE|nr:hypothetical protein JOB18_044625 [Solea senegalensis]
MGGRPTELLERIEPTPPLTPPYSVTPTCPVSSHLTPGVPDHMFHIKVQKPPHSDPTVSTLLSSYQTCVFSSSSHLKMMFRCVVVQVQEVARRMEFKEPPALNGITVAGPKSEADF